MALPVTDLFDQNTGSAQLIATYSAAWTVLEGSLQVPSGNVGRCEGVGSTYNTARRNDETFNADQYAQIVFVDTGNYCGPAVRCQSGANTSYHVESNGSTFYVSKCVAGSQSTLAGPVSQSFAVGDILRLEVSGTGATVTLQVFKALAASPTSFSQVGTDYTDSAGDRITTAGYGGVFVYGSTAGGGAGEWTAGNLGAAATADQEGFHFGADDGNEAAHTFHGSQDSNVTKPLAENVLLRALINGTGDVASAAYTLRMQKNGAGGYAAVPVGASSVTSPPQVSSATVASVTTAADPWSLTNGRPACSSGDMVVVVIGWDDSTTVTSVTPPAGPNSEAAVSIAGPVASASTEMRLQAWYYIATGSWTNATWSWDPSASETCRQAAFVIPAGQFKSSDPIGWASTSASTGTAESTLSSPTGTAEADDGDGRLFIAYGSDADAITAPASGTTTVNNGTTGGVGLCIVSRNTVVSDSESVAAIAATIASDSWASLAFVVKAAETNNELYVAPSSNITAGGEATTARLTAPSGKTTGDFVTGRRWDDENGTDTIDLTTDDYTEVEWCLQAQSPATNGDYFDFRVYAGGSALDSYTVTPRWTVGTPATPSSTPRGYRAQAFHLAALMSF